MLTLYFVFLISSFLCVLYKAKRLIQGLSRIQWCCWDTINDVKSPNSAPPCMQNLLISVKLFFNLSPNEECACWNGRRAGRDAFLQLSPLHGVWRNLSFFLHAIVEKWTSSSLAISPGRQPYGIPADKQLRMNQCRTDWETVLRLAGVKVGANPVLRYTSGKWS